MTCLLTFPQQLLNPFLKGGMFLALPFINGPGGSVIWSNNITQYPLTTQILSSDARIRRIPESELMPLNDNTLALLYSKITSQASFEILITTTEILVSRCYRILQQVGHSDETPVINQQWTFKNSRFCLGRVDFLTPVWSDGFSTKNWDHCWSWHLPANYLNMDEDIEMDISILANTSFYTRNGRYLSGCYCKLGLHLYDYSNEAPTWDDQNFEYFGEFPNIGSYNHSDYLNTNSPTPRLATKPPTRTTTAAPSEIIGTLNPHPINPTNYSTLNLMGSFCNIDSSYDQWLSIFVNHDKEKIAGCNLYLGATINDSPEVLVSFQRGEALPYVLSIVLMVGANSSNDLYLDCGSMRFVLSQKECLITESRSFNSVTSVLFIWVAFNLVYMLVWTIVRIRTLLFQP